MGPRVTNAAGTPIQSYRKDRLSASYRRERAAQVADAAASSQARCEHARQVAADIVAAHGTHLIVEDASIATWSRRWGAAVAAFSPGALVAAIDREARAVAAIAGARGGLERAATRPTALSQHCPCGTRVAKRLGDRIHACGACGLRGDRDAVAAVLASFVVFDPLGHSASVRVALCRHGQRAARDPCRALCVLLSGWQDTPSESTDLSARDGSFIAWRTSTSHIRRHRLRDCGVARRNVGTASCSTRDETGTCQTTSDRARVRTDMSSKYALTRAYLRDTS
jgi:hypothetical protein